MTLSADTRNTVTGTMFVYYQSSQPATGTWSSVATNFNYPHFSISLALNVILSFMMVARLILHSREIRNVMGVSAGAIYRTTIAMLAETSALYAVSYVLFIGPWGAHSSVGYIFFPILAETQVCIATTPEYSLIMVTNRSLLPSSSSCESPTGPH